MKYKCKFCNKEFDNYQQLGGHATSHLLNKKEIRRRIIEKRTLSRIKIEKTCPKCGSKFEVIRIVNGTENEPQKNERVYCSRKCSNSHIQTAKQNELRKNKLLAEKSPAYIDGRSIKQYSCISCGILIVKNKTGYCSKCLKQQKEYKEKIKAACKNNGGYRQQGGRGKQGWYKGYWCDSSWELAYVIYCLDHNIIIKRNHVGYEYIFEEKVFKYYPDFILQDGSFIEIKAFLDSKNKAKIEQFNYEKLQIIGKKEIKAYLDYVIEKYGENFIELYEGVK